MHNQIVQYYTIALYVKYMVQYIHTAHTVKTIRALIKKEPFSGTLNKTQHTSTTHTALHYSLHFGKCCPIYQAVFNTQHTPNIDRCALSQVLDDSGWDSWFLSEGKCVSLEIIVTRETNCTYNQIIQEHK